eukprot:scaffold160148_cov31-Tisochrysis_lutea.AAC.3
MPQAEGSGGGKIFVGGQRSKPSSASRDNWPVRKPIAPTQSLCGHRGGEPCLEPRQWLYHAEGSYIVCVRPARAVQKPSPWRARCSQVENSKARTWLIELGRLRREERHLVVHACSKHLRAIRCCSQGQHVCLVRTKAVDNGAMATVVEANTTA